MLPTDTVHIIRGGPGIVVLCGGTEYDKAVIAISRVHTVIIGIRPRLRYGYTVKKYVKYVDLS